MQNAYTKSLYSELDWSTSFSAEDFEMVSRNWDAYARIEMPDPPPPPRGQPQRPFSSLMFDIRPDMLKRYRLQMVTLLSGAGLQHPLPATSPIFTLVWGHYYIAVGHADLAMVDIVAARERGATKAEVAHLIGLAWFHSGNVGTNVTARLADGYMRAWNPDDGARGLTWPDSWTVKPEVFRCGIDFSTPPTEAPLTGSELKLLTDWHRRWQGEVPAYVEFLAEHFPVALRAYRARYENAMDGALPCQMVVLLQAHLAATWMCADTVRRAVHMAKALGVRKDEVAHALAFGQLALSEIGMDAAVRGITREFDQWES